jgi:drug/metabolite transporter (DMT)-like permease
MRGFDWLLLVFLSVLWGGAFFFIGVAVAEVPPLTLVFARVSIAALALLLLVPLLGYRLPATISGWRVFAVQAVINNVIPFSLIAFGQTRIASGLAAVLNATTPLFTLIVMRVLAQEPLTLHKTAGVVLGIVGVAVLMGPEVVVANVSSLLGMLAVLGGALSYGLSAYGMRRLREVPPLVSSAAQLSCSAVLLLPVAAYLDRFWMQPLPGPAAMASIIALALVSTALAFIVFFRISATAGPSNVMLVTLLIPVTATALGAAFLGEALKANEIAGALIIASGLLIIDGRLLSRIVPARAVP